MGWFGFFFGREWGVERVGRVVWEGGEGWGVGGERKGRGFFFLWGGGGRRRRRCFIFWEERRGRERGARLRPIRLRPSQAIRVGPIGFLFDLGHRKSYGLCGHTQ